MFSQSSLGLCCQPLPSPHTILHLHQMKDDEGAGLWGSRSEVNSRIIRSFHFYISGKDTFRMNTMNQAYYTFHTLSFHFFTRNLYGEWKLIWNDLDWDLQWRWAWRRHPGLSLSSFLIIKCKSLAGLRGFQLYGVFYWGFWPSQNGHRWLLAAAVTSPAISRGALPI